MNAPASPPLRQLAAALLRKFAEVEQWLRESFAASPPPFYASVDLRNNGKKIAPVDTNLFPAGFNNLPRECWALAAELLSREMSALCPSMKSVLLVPETHTRNAAYWENIAVLKHLLESAGIRVRLGADGERALTVAAAGDAPAMTVEPIEWDGGRPHCGGFYPCAVLLNNDLSSGVPAAFLKTEIPILPPARMGWGTRKKSDHFHHYRRAAEQLAALLDVDPYLLCADFSVCANVDFHRREGMECLAAAVEETLAQIREKYREHGIADAPFVVLKANAGTYGMGVMTVTSAEEVAAANRKTRNRMSVGKGGAPITEILIQEGIQTEDAVGGAPAEPVIYAIGGAVAGGFWRINEIRGARENLNSRGMRFAPMPAAAAIAPPLPAPAGADISPYIYGVTARLATLAAARETAAAESAEGKSALG